MKGKNPEYRVFKVTVIFVICLVCSGFAKTRWSSLQLVPSADMLKTGSFVLGFVSFFPFEEIASPVMGGSADIGFHDRINLQIGYVDGFNMGFKALLLSEPNVVLPSVAVGMQNLFSNREGGYFGNTDDSLTNELFFVFGKNFEAWRTRLHLGLQVSTNLEDNKVNPFLGVEKYLGAGIYINMEALRRDEHYCLSLFTALRFLKGALELNLGAVDFIQMFSDQEYDTFVKPGLRASLKFRGITRLGSLKGIEGVEDRIDKKGLAIDALRAQIDTLKGAVKKQSSSIDSLTNAVVTISGNIEADSSRMRLMVNEKLIALKTLYEQEPFDPAQVTSAERELISYRDRIVPYLMDKVLDIKADHKIRTLSVSLLGKIGNRLASDVLLEILGTSKDPEIKIVTLIALGKMKETRAGYLMQVLSSDPNDAVAFTATEVLRELEAQTGMDFSSSAIRQIQNEEAAEEEVVDDSVVGFSIDGEEEHIDTTEEEPAAEPAQQEQNAETGEASDEQPTSEENAEASDGEEEHRW